MKLMLTLLVFGMVLFGCLADEGKVVFTKNMTYLDAYEQCYNRCVEMNELKGQPLIESCGAMGEYCYCSCRY